MSNEQVSKIVNELKTSIRIKYVEAQNKFIEATNLKVGDKVKVLRKAKDNELGWNNRWVDDMKNWVGEINEVINFNATSGIRVYSSERKDSWNFPFFVLEKVEEPEYEFKNKDVVLVRDEDTDTWRIDVFKDYDNRAGKYKYITYDNGTYDTSWAQCIPYKGHEHLFGTKCPADC